MACWNTDQQNILHHGSFLKQSTEPFTVGRPTLLKHRCPLKSVSDEQRWRQICFKTILKNRCPLKSVLMNTDGGQTMLNIDAAVCSKNRYPRNYDEQRWFIGKLMLKHRCREIMMNTDGGQTYESKTSMALWCRHEPQEHILRIDGIQRNT